MSNIAVEKQYSCLTLLLESLKTCLFWMFFPCLYFSMETFQFMKTLIQNMLFYLMYTFNWLFQWSISASDDTKDLENHQLTIEFKESQNQQPQPVFQYLDPYKNGNRGLNNLGNTCYMNCVLQCLHKSKYFNYNLQRELKKRGQTYLQQNNRTLTNHYDKMSKQLWQQGKPYSPLLIKRIVASQNIMFQYNQQNDATEFLSTFLSIISRQLDNSPKLKKFEDIDPKKITKQSQIWAITKRNDKLERHSVIEETFTGRYRTSYLCKKCGFDYIMFQKFNIHYVKIPQDKADAYSGEKEYNLMDCLKQFEKTDKLRGDDKMTCDKCLEETDTDKTMKVWETNKILIIGIQRFNNGYKDQRRVKVPAQITQRNKSYQLYAACLHSGSLNSGHYTAVCLNYKTNQWVYFNDSRWSLIKSFDQINLDNAYALFYAQI